MTKYKVDICGINTSLLKTISWERMQQLFLMLKDGDKSVRDELIYGNLKLVLSILKPFNGKENMDDLFQVGCIGLLKAIDNFDLSFGVKFSTYSVPMILGEVKRYLRDNSSIRVSRSIKDIAYKVLKLKDEIVVTKGVEPSNAEIAKILSIPEIDIINALEALRPVESLYEPIYNDGGDTIYLCDQVPDTKDSFDLDSKMACENALKSLSNREKYILNQRFIIGKTQMEIADELEISQAQISRLEKTAISRIRKQF